MARNKVLQERRGYFVFLEELGGNIPPSRWEYFVTHKEFSGKSLLVSTFLLLKDPRENLVKT